MPLTDVDESKRQASDPNFTIDLAEYGQIKAIRFSPYEWSQNVLLLSFVKKIVIAHVNIQEDLQFEKIAEYHHDYRLDVLALSPDTHTNFLPTTVQFCAAADHHQLHLYEGDLTNYTFKVLSGHSNYINDISYDPENNYISSVSDDHTAKLWSTSDHTCVATLYLSSPGVSTCWHRDDSSKLLVAEKIGIIRFYNVDSRKPILSIDYGMPLSSVDWAPSDAQMIASLQMGELLVWDLTRPSFPTIGSRIYTETGGHLKFSPMGELMALANCLDGSLKVVHLKSQQQRLYAKVNVPTNLAWHFRLPYVCIGDDTKLFFWKVVCK